MKATGIVRGIEARVIIKVSLNLVVLDFRGIYKEKFLT